MIINFIRQQDLLLEHWRYWVVWNHLLTAFILLGYLVFVDNSVIASPVRITKDEIFLDTEEKKWRQSLAVSQKFSLRKRPALPFKTLSLCESDCTRLGSNLNTACRFQTIRR